MATVVKGAGGGALKVTNGYPVLRKSKDGLIKKGTFFNDEKNPNEIEYTLDGPTYRYNSIVNDNVTIGISIDTDSVYQTIIFSVSMINHITKKITSLKLSINNTNYATPAFSVNSDKEYVYLHYDNMNRDSSKRYHITPTIIILKLDINIEEITKIKTLTAPTIDQENSYVTGVGGASMTIIKDDIFIRTSYGIYTNAGYRIHHSVNDFILYTEDLACNNMRPMGEYIIIPQNSNIGVYRFEDEKLKAIASVYVSLMESVHKFFIPPSDPYMAFIEDSTYKVKVIFKFINDEITCTGIGTYGLTSLNLDVIYSEFVEENKWYIITKNFRGYFEKISDKHYSIESLYNSSGPYMTNNNKEHIFTNSLTKINADNLDYVIVPSDKPLGITTNDVGCELKEVYISKQLRDSYTLTIK